MNPLAKFWLLITAQDPALQKSGVLDGIIPCRDATEDE